MYTAVCVAADKPWFGHEVKQGNVLYADSELDQDEMTIRAYQVSEGMGLEQPPENLYYYPLKGIGLMPSLESMQAFKKQYKLDLIIVDSLTIALAAMDVSTSKEMIPAMEMIERRLGTVLILDHTPKLQFGADPSALTQFGSGFKRHMARSSFKLTGNNSNAVVLEHEKHNFGRLLEQIPFIYQWSENDQTVTLVPKDIMDEEFAQIRAMVGAKNKVLMEFADGKTHTRGDLFARLCVGTPPEMSRASLDTQLKVLVYEKKLQQSDRGTYCSAGVLMSEPVEAWKDDDERDAPELSPRVAALLGESLPA